MQIMKAVYTINQKQVQSKLRITHTNPNLYPKSYSKI